MEGSTPETESHNEEGRRKQRTRGRGERPLRRQRTLRGEWRGEEGRRGMLLGRSRGAIDPPPLQATGRRQSRSRSALEGNLSVLTTDRAEPLSSGEISSSSCCIGISAILQRQTQGSGPGQRGGPPPSLRRSSHTPSPCPLLSASLMTTRKGCPKSREQSAAEALMSPLQTNVTTPGSGGETLVFGLGVRQRRFPCRLGT